MDHVKAFKSNYYAAHSVALVALQCQDNLEAGIMWARHRVENCSTVGYIYCPMFGLRESGDKLSHGYAVRSQLMVSKRMLIIVSRLL